MPELTTDHESAGAVLTDTTASIRAELVDKIEPERLARIAEALPADEAADLIGELEVAVYFSVATGMLVAIV